MKKYFHFVLILLLPLISSYGDNITVVGNYLKDVSGTNSVVSDSNIISKEDVVRNNADFYVKDYIHLRARAFAKLIKLLASDKKIF